jgi:photosystem II stability/assembly factor-like uncharacterized protein
MKRKSIILILFLGFCKLSYSQWETLYFPFGGGPQLPDLNAVCFKNVESGFAVGNDQNYPAIIRTNDKGVTWDTVFLTTDISSFRDIFISDTLKAFAVGSFTGGSGIIARTSDFGNSWDTLITVNELTAVNFPTSQIGYIVGFNGTLLKTVDSGISWTNLTMSIANNFNSVQFLNDSVGFICGDTNIFRTQNGGITWTLSSFTHEMTALNFSSENIGYCLSHPTIDSVDLFKTIDGGLTWTLYSSFPGLHFFSSMCFMNDTVGYVTEVFDIEKTIDGGQSWTSQASSPPSWGDFMDWVSDVYFVNNDTGYAVGAGGSGHVYRTYNGGDSLTTSINMTEKNFIAASVSPNPFNNRTIISFSNPDRRATHLDIYNVLGKKMRTSITDENTVMVDRENLNAGIYIYRLTQGTTIISSGKLILTN